VLHTKTVMAITKKRFLTRVLSLERVGEPEPLKDSGICHLQRLIEKTAPTQKAGARAGNWSIGQSWPTRYPRMWSASNPTVASYGTSVQFNPVRTSGGQLARFEIVLKSKNGLPPTPVTPFNPVG
jgi:hypothetical protein